MFATRRDFLVLAASAGTFAVLPDYLRRRAGDVSSLYSRSITVDALCYADDVSSSDAKECIAAGLTAAVFDIAAHPRNWENAVHELSLWDERFAEQSATLLCIRKGAHFTQAKQQGKLGLVLACQDANILGVPTSDWPAALRMFHTLGLRALLLTHNERTPWADSFAERRDGGLSRAGEALVREMNRVGMIIDLSHSSRQTLLDTVALSAKPCIVSHAGCTALAPTARNKGDAEIRALGAKGGFFGVFDMGCWLTNKPHVTLGNVLDHIDHAAQLIGPQHLGFGSDGGLVRLNAEAELERMRRVQQLNAGEPSAEWPVSQVRVPELNAPDRLRVIAEALSDRGYRDVDVAGIIGGNFVRLFSEVCG